MEEQKPQAPGFWSTLLGIAVPLAATLLIFVIVVLTNNTNGVT